MDILRLIKLKAHQLKMYIYDVYRFIDAKIMVERMEKDIFRDIESVRDELQEFSNTRTEAMDKVNEATTPTQLEEKLTEFEVTLSTDTSEELEEIRSSMDRLDKQMNRTDPPKYHSKIIEQMNQALDALENDLERNVHILNSIIERLDRQADPQEMARELKEFKTGQESQELGEVQNHVDTAQSVFSQNSLQRLAGWKKMLSPNIYRTEKSNEQDFDSEIDEDIDDDFGADIEDDSDLGFEDEEFSDTSEEFETEFDEGF